MRKINILAPNSKFVCAENGGGYVGPGSLIANRTIPLQWEGFVEEPFEDGFSYKTYNGNYITAELNGDVSTDRTARGAWEKWFKVGDSSFKSVHGNFLEWNPLDDYLYARKPTTSGNTIFTVNDITPTTSALHVQDKYFYDEMGRKVYLRGATDFMLYKWTLEGKDVTPIIKQRKENKVNAVRIIGMVSWFDYTPQKYGQPYYDNIPTFCDLLLSHGMYVYWTVFADTQIVMPILNNQVDHFNKVIAKLKERKNTLGDLVNEPGDHQNATANPLAFTRPTGIPFSSGGWSSYPGSKEGKPTPGPYWDFQEMHWPRKDIKRVKDQCVSDNPNYLQKGQAIVSGESDKFGGPNEFNAQVYLTDPDLSRQMETTARGTEAGYFYHISAGVYSVLWNDTEVRCCPFTMGD